LGRSVHTIKQNAEALVVASKESEANADKTKYMIMSRDQKMQDEVTGQRLIIVPLTNIICREFLD